MGRECILLLQDFQGLNNMKRAYTNQFYKSIAYGLMKSFIEDLKYVAS